jgi:biotin transport system ATP-binding protein
VIQVTGLSHSFQGSSSAVFDGIDLDITDGEYVALIGPNGCGKTTFARHLNGLLIPSNGQIVVDGMNTRDKRNLGEIRRRVGMIFQNPENQIVGATVEEDVAFGPSNLRLPPGEIRGLVKSSLATVGLTGYELRHPHTLSGGEKQMLAVAGILAMKPRYVVLDEPTSSLDPISREKVLSVIRGLIGKGIGIIHITHLMEDIVMAHRVIVLNKGTVATQGTPLEILSRVDWLRSLGLAAPPVTDLMWRLHRVAPAIDPSVITVEDAVSHIAAVMGGGMQKETDLPETMGLQ